MTNPALRGSSFGHLGWDRCPFLLQASMEVESSPRLVDFVCRLELVR